MGTGGMTGMGSALAAEPTTVAVSGTLVDGSGHPLGGVHLTIVEELPPDGGIAAFPVTTGTDGSFGADLYAWGTAAAPASVSIETAAGEELTVEGDSCSRTWGVTVSDHHDWALSEAAPEPLTVTAATTLLGEVCGTTGTPGGGSSNGGGANLTPPPTDATLRAAGAGDRLGPALTIGFVLGLIIAAGLLVPKPGSRRRD
jgi:hypothetical protein